MMRLGTTLDDNKEQSSNCLIYFINRHNLHETDLIVFCVASQLCKLLQ